MAMLKKWLLTSLMAVALVFVSFANTVHITFAEGKTAKLAIIGESQKGIMLCPKEVSIEDGETAFSLLQKVMGDKVISESMSFGTYIKGIDGLMAGATSGWLYDVNDKSAEVGADSYKLESGDVVAFRYVADWSNMSQETLQQTLDKFGTCKTVEEPKPEEPKTEKPDGKPEESKTEKPDGKPEEPKTEKPDGKPEEPKTEKPDGKPEDKVTEQPKQEKVEIPAAQLNEAISKTSEKMLQDGIGSDWVAIGLARSGVNIPLETKINYVQPVAEKVKKRLNRFSATDLARTIIMMNAMNVDPTKVEGQNLVQNLFESDKVNSVTGYAFTLLALDTKKYEVPAEAKWNRATLVQALLQSQHTDGGWTYDSSSSKESASSVDVTSMVLAALAPYQDQTDVKPAIQKAVDYLYKQQLGNGGFAADGQENSNSTAQAIIGLSLVKDVDQDRLNKAVQNVMSYQLSDGEFKWLPSDQKGSGMATEQAFLALLQFKDLGKSIYDWSNVVENEIDTKPIVEPETTVEEKEVVEQPKQQEELQKQPKDENLKVVVDNERVNKETNKNKNQLPQTGATSHSTATQVGMGVLCIASAYVLWRRKAA
ncbi:cell wall anchor protein [Bacillus cereus]|nr:cell wall anchor protein [Bacillus cereus]PFE68548.1 cell wall anchor protein [Bacillus cereus]PFP98789.1 cell wall anchor protein [Bacillus cereus]PGN89408.1 cell wall anchor protein [Bacillus cereus]PGU33292.1 cell wall anchor protein [Bacillus cereus]